MENTKFSLEYQNTSSSLLPLVVDVEKVRVETGLEYACQDNNSLGSLTSHHSPDPIKEVESTVSTEGH